MTTRAQTSVQLFTVREPLENDFEGTLERLAALGLQNVEPFDFVGNASQYEKALAATGLAMPTAHSMVLPAEELPNRPLMDVPPLDQTLEEAAALGVKTIFHPVRVAWNTKDDVKLLADGLNAAAERAASFGIRVGYHNHAWEVQHEFDGLVGLEYLSTQLVPEVKLEVDLFWANLGGAVLPVLLESLGNRVQSVHVKDGTKLAPRYFGFGVVGRDELHQVPAGQGDVDLAGALAAAQAAEYRVIEYDVFDGDIFDGVKQSFDFLQEQQA